MKIVCGSCGAKYSIADEKVQGKVFKIRCKKCSNVIVVKGNEDGDETVSGSVGATAAAEWYVVIDGEQAGPMTPSEIEAHFMAGRVSAESFAWRDGLTDWVPLSKLDDFSHLSNERGAGPEEATQISDDYSHYQKKVNEEADETSVMSAPSSNYGAAASSFSSFDSEPDNGNFSSGFSDFGSSNSDDYGYAAAGGGSDSAYESGGLFSNFDSPSSGPAIQSASGGGGMFASFDGGSSSNDDFLGLSSNEPMPSRSKSTAGGIGASLAAAPVASDLVGKRNENSVLFSLSSLDQVQSVGGGSKSSEPAADVPVTDGSGLIDIRALASAHKSMKSSGPASFDDGPSVDPFTTGTMAMPALMPMGSHRSNKPLIIGGVIGGLVLLGVIGALGYVVMTKNDQPQTITERVIIQEKIVQAANPEADAKAAAEAAAAEKQALEGNTDTAVAAAEPATDPKTKATSSVRKTNDTKTAAPTEEPKEEPKAVAKAEPKGDGIDRLLNSIDEGEKPATKKETKKETTASSSSGSKDKLDKADVLNTIKAYAGRVNTCYKSQNANNLNGTMKVKFLIKPNGSVTNVEVASGEFAGTDVGRCVVKAVSGMRFPATSASDNVPVTYPFKLE